MFCYTHGRKPFIICVCLHLCQPDDVAVQPLSKHNMQLLKAAQSVLLFVCPTIDVLASNIVALYAVVHIQQLC